MRIFCVIAILSCFVQSTFAATASRRSCIPVVGHWRGSSTTLALTNVEPDPARVTLTWISGSPHGYAPPRFQLTLHGHETRLIDVGTELLQGREAVGGLSVRSEATIAARAFISGRAGGPPATLDAIPIRHTIANGRTSTIAGFGGARGYRLFVAETKGHAIYFSAAVVAGDERGTRSYYVEPSQQVTLQIDRDFNIKPGEPFTLILRGVNGSGRLAAAGAAVLETGDIVVSEMNSIVKPAHRLRASEVMLYGISGLGLGATVLFRRRSASLSR